MRQEYKDKMRSLLPQEQERFDKKEIDEQKDLMMDKADYLYNLHMNIRFVFHQRFMNHKLHGHDFVEMMYVINGHITHVINGKEITLNEGDILIMNRYVKHEVKTCYEEDLAVNFLFMPEFFDEVLKLNASGKNKYVLHFIIDILQDDKKPHYMIFETSENVAVGDLLEILMLPWIERNMEENEDAQILLALIFKYLAKDYNSITNKVMDEIIDENILSYINNNYKSATLGELSRRLNKPLSTVSRHIKNTAGCNFNELVKQKRFKKATELLVKTDMSIVEIMHSVGYENSSYFYNEFKKRYGCSPADFRKNNKNK